MEIRRTDFNHVMAAGWVRPADWTEWKISRTVKVDVPLYRLGDIEDALYELPRIVPRLDWGEVRGARPGEPSPLLKHTRHPGRRT
ncbi:hypothetical protein [Thermomonospora umbrina]|uniref:Uncharacterized protein n=1 Tax=Thermomonospora umbrina TaxID=111806 RepID=A0A3D9T704_9ACTN|nr:hypothetical protein [Thermomonospora umbrina]REF00455.1 hypothetical protein DFJ69_5993 [Thermomonospora umbrina]